MSVLNIVFTTIKDDEKLHAYIKAAGPLMKENGGEVLLRGKYLSSLFGDTKNGHLAAVFRFPDMNAAENFYNCDAYRELIPLRDAGGDISFDFYEE
ncbi:DUF1330 domain-containing protein [uncultured Roseovarius sp.]|uniref:DUF1330 domain-containing protein n=1 Tax=uncultured Roseovarius sp. TaxID=293344 RepID=UPI002612F98F|nr:DUF1330 domain-containing protein [uncultured Roseovarius sp.]